MPALILKLFGIRPFPDPPAGIRTYTTRNGINRHRFIQIMKLKDPVRPIAREADLVIQEVEDEVLVYDLNTNKASCLNATAASVWRHCNGQNDLSEIAAAMRVTTDIQVDDEVVWLAIDQLRRADLLRTAPRLPKSFSGMTRRELAKRVALASAAAIPVISSLVAPKPVHANSACVLGGACLCLDNSGGMQGQICTASVPCADVDCRCAWENSGNMNGTCTF